MELFKEIIPRLSRVGVLGTSTDNPGNAQALRETELAAEAFALQVHYLDVPSPKDIGTAFRAAVKQRADALLLLGSPVFQGHDTAQPAGESRQGDPMKVGSEQRPIGNSPHKAKRKSVFCFALCVLLFGIWETSGAQQQTRIARVGVLVAGRPPSRPSLEGFRQGLRDLGYVEGKNIHLELRWDEGNDRWAQLASELARLNVDVILAGHGAAALGAKRATTTIPIVVGAVGGDPVAAGLVASLARPGGNITGLAFYGSELSAKRLELLKETLPRLSRTVLLYHPSALNLESTLKELQATAQSLSLKLQQLDVSQGADLDAAFREARQQKAGAALIGQSAFFGTFRTEIGKLGLKYRMPTIAGEAEFAESGGLMFYGQNIPNTWRRAAAYVDKILKGAKPADLPIEQPTKFEFIVNLKTAKQIGLTVPPNVLARADRVIR